MVVLSIKNLVVLASGGGSNLEALLVAEQTGELAIDGVGGRIVAVVSDVPDAGALEVARAFGVATAVVRPADFPSRQLWDEALTKAISAFSPDYVVSAGFMRILGATFLTSFGGLTINTHPALLPAFPGSHGVSDALAYGVKVTGCTVHLVDAGVDTGPILAQAAVAVQEDDTVASLHERIKEVERRLLVECVAKLCAFGVQSDGRKATFGN